MAKHTITVEQQRALSRKLFAAAYDRLWRRSAAGMRSPHAELPLHVTLDQVRQAFEETTEAIGTRSFLPPREE